MPHKFVILNNGNLETYDNFDDIPKRFDNLIKFLPEVPDAPHTDEQHEEMHQWNEKLKDLLEREK